MEHLNWKMPMKAEWTNVQKVLAVLVLLPTIPFIAFVCTLFNPRLRLQEGLLSMGAMPAFLLAGTAACILALVLCIPNSYKSLSIYLGAALGAYFVYVARVDAPVLGAMTWVIVAASACALSYLRSKDHDAGGGTPPKT